MNRPLTPSPSSARVIRNLDSRRHKEEYIVMMESVQHELAYWLHRRHDLTKAQAEDLADRVRAAGKVDLKYWGLIDRRAEALKAPIDPSRTIWIGGKPPAGA